MILVMQIYVVLFKAAALKKEYKNE